MFQALQSLWMEESFIDIGNARGETGLRKIVLSWALIWGAVVHLYAVRTMMFSVPHS